MVFNLGNSIYPKYLSPHLTQTAIRRDATQRLVEFPIRAEEMRLNDILMQNYGMNLRTACGLIIRSIKVYNTSDGTLYARPKSQLYDRLAKFITYGVGDAFGSQILTYAITGRIM